MKTKNSHTISSLKSYSCIYPKIYFLLRSQLAGMGILSIKGILRIRICKKLRYGNTGWILLCKKYSKTFYSLHYEKFADGIVKCIEEEIPFELPEGWAWTRFSAITINRDSERKPISSSQRTDVAKIYDYYGASGKIDKIDKYIFDERLLLIGEDGANLVTRSKPIAFFAEGQYWVNNHAHCIDATDKFILEYLCFYINAISLGKYVTGSAQSKMTQDNMNSILIPLPPYSEQKRMSQRLNEVMYTVDNIEIGKVAIRELASKAKSKILDLAIRGQLVPQNPDDEPASVLLERIRASFPLLSANSACHFAIYFSISSILSFSVLLNKISH